jgi:hypothetical protein
VAKERDELSVTQAAAKLGAHEDTVRRHAQRAAEGDDRARFAPDSVRQDWSGRWWIKRGEVDRQLAAIGGARDNL